MLRANRYPHNIRYHKLDRRELEQLEPMDSMVSIWGPNMRKVLDWSAKYPDLFGAYFTPQEFRARMDRITKLSTPLAEDPEFSAVKWLIVLGMEPAQMPPMPTRPPLNVRGMDKEGKPIVIDDDAYSADYWDARLGKSKRWSRKLNYEAMNKGIV